MTNTTQHKDETYCAIRNEILLRHFKIECNIAFMIENVPIGIWYSAEVKNLARILCPIDGSKRNIGFVP